MNYPRGGDTNIKAGETYVLNKIEDLKNPTANIQVEPAFYFAKIYAFDVNGIRSNGSEKFCWRRKFAGTTIRHLQISVRRNFRLQ